ncbi:hypothetical protein ACRRTK_012887 [Alexandromys fortis]
MSACMPPCPTVMSMDLVFRRKFPPEIELGLFFASILPLVSTKHPLNQARGSRGSNILSLAAGLSFVVWETGLRTA